MKRIALSFVSFLVMLSIVLAACTTEPTAVPATQAPEVSAATQAPEATEAPQPKQLTVALLIDVVDMDPHRAYADSWLIAGKAMYETLTQEDLENPGQLKPELAESWEINEDSTVYTFHLRKGVKFESGREMKAKDVVWSWQRLRNLQGPPSWAMDGVKSVEAVDDYTVKVTMESSDASFLAKTSVCYFGPMDSEVAEEHGCVAGPDAATADTCKEWLDQHSIGAGPYRLERWIPDSEIRLVPNPDYYGGTPTFDSVVFKHVADATTQAQMLGRGDVDIAINIDPDTAKQLEGKPGVILDKGLSLSIVYLAMNTRAEVSEMTSNKLFRQAVLHAIDHEGLTTALGGTTPPGLISLGLLGGGEAEAISYDVEKAKQLLAEAGYADGVELDMHYPGIVQFGVDFNVVAQKLQADLAAIGITLNLFPEEFSVWIAPYRAGESPITLGYSTPDYGDADAVTQIFGADFGVFAKRMDYADPEATELVMAGNRTTDLAKRTEIYRELQNKMNEDAVFNALLQPDEVIGYRDNITGFRKYPVNKLNLFEMDKK